MPVWLVSALRMLLGTPARAALTGAGVATGVSGLARGDITPGIPGLDLFGEPVKKRRRRRRALTASDRADIGFLTGLLGPSAAKQLATVIITRSASA